MEKNKKEEIKKVDKSGEELLEEYFEQDSDDKHHMGYGVYSRTESSGCCC